MKNDGFTIIELVTIIAVLAVLAGIAIVGYGTWRSSTIKNGLSADLSAAASAMEQELNFTNTYPITIPKSYKGNTTIVVKSSSMTTNPPSFCLEAEKDGIRMHWKTGYSHAQDNGC